jgi:hypothetical protein
MSRHTFSFFFLFSLFPSAKTPLSHRANIAHKECEWKDGVLWFTLPGVPAARS